MNIVDVISRKRDGNKHNEEELAFIASAASSKQDAADYQLSAWLMAAYINGLDDDETLWLTLAMARSGERLDLSRLPRPWMDKHSTGGVGDKTTLVLLPLLSACGLTMVKMSGRGLGITGGTIDKLESIPGFRTDLLPGEMLEQAAKIGLAITGQSPNLAPADKTLYALRDTTGTVSSIPLIVASILSKKIAGGADHLVLDVKCGSGAFMKDILSARKLGAKLKQVAEMAGMKTSVAITDMSQPLGGSVGNALEVKEAFDILHGLRNRFSELCIELAGGALFNAGLSESAERGSEVARQKLENGEAAAKWNLWIEAQTEGKLRGEQVRQSLPVAPVIRDITWEAPAAALTRADAGTIGEAVLSLGGGRRKKTDQVDHRVGVVFPRELGTRVEPGDAIATIHAASEVDADRAQATILSAFDVDLNNIPELKALNQWLS